MESNGVHLDSARLRLESKRDPFGLRFSNPNLSHSESIMFQHQKSQNRCRFLFQIHSDRNETCLKPGLALTICTVKLLARYRSRRLGSKTPCRVASSSTTRNARLSGRRLVVLVASFHHVNQERLLRWVRCELSNDVMLPQKQRLRTRVKVLKNLC